MTVIVTNAKNRIAYNIVKSLGQKAIEVYTSDFVPLSMSFASRYSKGHFIYPSPFRNQNEFIECLLKNIYRLKANVLIPVFEETFLISKFKNKLLEHVQMVVPDYEQILNVHNKDRWQPIAAKLNIPFPKSCTIDELKKSNCEIKELRYPVLLKPKQGGGGWAIKQVGSPRELENNLNQSSNNGLSWDRFFVQEKIEGETHCVAMLFRKGELKAKVTYKQLRDYPTTGGQATLRISIRNEKAEESFQKMLEELRWHGICQADFIVDKKTNIPYLIDINPRFWGSLIQGIASGVDFPYLLYRIAIDGDVNPVKEFKTGVMTRWIGGDIRTFLPFFKKSKNKMQFLHSFIFPGNGKIFYDDFSLKDPLPFLTWIFDALLRVIKYKSLNPIPHDSLEGVWD
jgi:predicted ATP-grasp superfamily ATP-dependent carboligase